jgi:thiamine biosynthesis lipoprotein
MKQVLERQENLTLLQERVVGVEIFDGVARGVRKVLAVVTEVCLNRPEWVRSVLQQETDPIVQQRYLMGSLCSITAFGEPVRTKAALTAAFEEIRRIDGLISHYQEGSELSRVNRSAGREAVAVSSETAGFVKLCLDYSEATSGAFDVTVGPAVRAWGFFDGKFRVPSESELDRLRGLISSRSVEISEGRVRLSREGMLLDPGGIGKGYAVDRAARVLKAAGVTSALVDFGSSLIAIGAPPEEAGWKIGVRDPRRQDGVLGQVHLKDRAISTSGSYEKFFENGGRRYTHILDPRTARPVEGMLSTTVICDAGVESDVLSTALFVLGPEKGRDLAVRRGVDALLILEKGEEVSAGRWKDLFHRE